MKKTTQTLRVAKGHELVLPVAAAKEGKDRVAGGIG